jgi:hypothetical protein
MRVSLVRAAIVVQAALMSCTAVVAHGSLTMEMYASALNGVPITPTKLVQVSHVGDVVTMQVRAVVTGSDPTKYQLFKAASGSILSTGALKGDISSNVVASILKATSWSRGFSQDLDADGDLDLGSNDPQAAQHYIAYRSFDYLGPNSTDSFGNAVFSPGFEAFPTTPSTSHTYFATQRVNFTVTAMGLDTAVNFRPRLAGASAAWSTNGTEVVTITDEGDLVRSYNVGLPSDSNNDYFAGAPVIVTSVPEPAIVGLAGFAILHGNRRRSRAGHVLVPRD